MCVDICTDGAKAKVGEIDGALAQSMAGGLSNTRHYTLHSHTLSVKKKVPVLVKNSLEEGVRGY